MEFHRRRGRRRRGELIDTLTIPNQSCVQQWNPRQWTSILSGITSLLILSSLIGIIYLMIDYQNHFGNTKANINQFATSVEKITNDLSMMHNKYNELAIKISKLSQEVTRLEGQIAILEAMTNNAIHQEMGWDRRRPFQMPTFDELLRNILVEGKNNSKNNMKSWKFLEKSNETKRNRPQQVIY